MIKAKCGIGIVNRERGGGIFTFKIQIE